jgi:hypothetical protein
MHMYVLCPQIFRRILSSPLDLKSGAWASLSDGAKDLVRRMLARSPKRRIAPENVSQFDPRGWGLARVGVHGIGRGPCCVVLSMQQKSIMAGVSWDEL